MTEEQRLLHLFDTGELPPDWFSHENHVKLAWLCLREADAPAAMTRVKANLRRLVAKLGREEKYHETITCALIALTAERMARMGEEAGDWRRFKSANRDLFQDWRSCLDGYYRPETLSSELARRAFVLPDRGLHAA